MKSVRNTSPHPIEIDSGRVLASGETAEIDERGQLAQHYIDTGHLKKTRKAKQQKKALPKTDKE